MMLGEAGRNPPGKDRISRLPAGSPGCGLAVAHGSLVRLGVGLLHGVGLA
jgi:broad specificity phosphatase PhoE